jgi:MFS family permease
VSNHPFVPLRHRKVRLLWGAAVISDIGTWVQLIVVGSLVAADTGSAIKTGLVALATFMPQGIASPLGGLLADRYDRRKVFASALFAQACATGALAVVLGAGVRSPAVLTALILVGGAAGSTGAPSYAAMQPDLVPPEELMAVVSLGAYSWNSGRIIGPLLGSVMALAVGPAWTVAFNAATFLVMAMAVLLVRGRYLGHDRGGSMRERLRGGWDAMRRTPACWHGVVLLVLFNLTVVPYMGLIPIYVRSEFEGGTGMAGTVAAAQGIGAIVGGITVTMVVQRVRRSSVVAGLIVLLAAATVGYALVPTSTLLPVAAFLLGSVSSAVFITSSSIIQRDAPPSSRGRVMSLMQASMGISYGIGLMFIGGLGDLTSLRVAFLAASVLVLIGWTGLRMRSRHWRRAFDGTPQPAPQATLVG